ncbi:MAG: quinolinate phosphoribosyl transferase [Eubacteriaceae bacterium]|jgi:nicotinate-nucleotide pyrophosphorylase (carboxylating)|nr:quinolinate phosphoribosyl transferase [Eubacteriaceae bacterium]
MDIRECIFSDIIGKKYVAEVKALQKGILSGIEEGLEVLHQLNIKILAHQHEGDLLEVGTTIVTMMGTPIQLSKAEEYFAGYVSKTSGIATAARKAVELAENKMKIVCGAYKKMPQANKASFRKAVSTGSAMVRMYEEPFVYLDKNYIRMLGGIPNALKAVSFIKNRKKVVQIHHLYAPIEVEVVQAIEGGADLLMIDTGNIHDLNICLELLKDNPNHTMELAFSGDVQLEDIPKFRHMGLSRLCIGKSILDSKMLDVTFDIQI